MLTTAEVTDIKAALALAQTDIPGLTHSAFLKMADRASHAVFSTVGHVLKITGLKLQGERRDVTSQLSGGWLESLSVLKHGGVLSFRVHFLQSDASLNFSTGIAAAALEQTLERFQVTYADGSGLEFWAYADLDFDAPVNSRLTARVNLFVSGAVTQILS